MAVLILVPAWGGALTGRHKLDQVNRQLHGHIVDYTHNHGSDNRIWSAALCQRRDMYVYLPPCYDPTQLYPLGMYLHGASQDEQSFLKMVQLFDDAIASGQLPPVIIAVPDGSIQGKPSLFHSASFLANTRAGNFEDYIIEDVWNFVVEHYPIRPEREAHALVGASMGGAAAFSHGIKYRDRFKIIVGFHPALNLRWVDCHDHYRADFDPCCWGWRTRLNPHEALGRAHGVTVRFKYLLDPLVGRGPDAMPAISAFNPIEQMERYDLREGELDMYILYGGHDELNIDAQVESFLYCAHERGLTVHVSYDPKGRHDLATGERLFPELVDWVAPLVAPYSPGLICKPE
jgi:S-formylglutathione hydrolase FrmB